MPQRHALELVADAAGEAAIRADWQALRDAGLRSMLDHTGASNTPHVTVIALEAIGTEAEERAVALVGGLLPVEVVTSGLAVFGGSAVTLVRRLPRADLPRALEVLGHSSVRVSLTALRRWDPELREVRTLARTV